MARVIIDADGCPVWRIAEQSARRHAVGCVIVCDHAHSFQSDYAAVTTTDVGADSVDLKISNLMATGDIVITQDYGLAALCLARGGRVLRQDGAEYTKENIDGLLLHRHESRKARRAGQRFKGPAKRTAAQDDAFRQALDKLLKESTAAN